jgi:hypothetical protein
MAFHIKLKPHSALGVQPPPISAHHTALASLNAESKGWQS